MEVTWSTSVEKARLATMKTFEGRMEAAAASFEQIPPGSGRKAAGVKTLVEFAEEAEMEYKTLQEYRSVWDWLGRNDRYLPVIRSYSTAVEAMKSKQWADGAEFAAFIESTEPPVWEKDGYHPHQFKSWGVDALRVHLGKKPTNVALVVMEQAAKGKEPTPDALHAAAAKDHIDEARDDAEQVTDPNESREVLGAASQLAEDAENKHLSNIGAGVELDVRPHSMELLDEALEELGHLKKHGGRLLELARMDGWTDDDRAAVVSSLRARVDALAVVADVFDNPDSARVPDTVESLLGGA